MKLLHCKDCNDLFVLNTVQRHCQCRRSQGRYVNDRSVRVSGNCAVMGLDTRKFKAAVNRPVRDISIPAFIIHEPNPFIWRNK